MKKRGTIAILTGGGDVPGLNPAIRAVTIRALREGYDVIGLRRGWAGITEMVRDKQIRLLKIDGVYPEPKTIKSREYPLASEFYAVTAGSKNPNIEHFIEWILSPQGQSIIEKTGYTAIAD